MSKRIHSPVTREEMETHFWYDYMDNELTVYTNVPSHVTTMKKLWGKPHESTEYGKTWILPGNRIRMPRPKRKMSKSQKEHLDTILRTRKK